MTWQPIETAPKDGSSVFAYMDGKPLIVHWDDERFTTRPQPHWTPWAPLWGKAWARQHQPTHWQPLPEPPTSTTSATTAPDDPPAAA